ncbi:MAG: endo alpha-1,4 polygalactosaminidase [Patulibacter sp.]
MTRPVPAVVAARAAVLACMLAGACPSGALAAEQTAKARLGAAKSFTMALGATLTTSKIARLATRDLVVVDGDDTSAKQVAGLQRRDAVVLGYLSVGTVEAWRSWFSLLRNDRLEALGDWNGERYANVSSAALRDALADQIAPQLLAKGFDGLLLGNVEMVEDHAAQADGMLELVTRIAARVHAAGGVLMAQNGDTIITPYLPLLDGWNREDASGTYDASSGKYVATGADARRAARATLAAVRAAGVITTTTDYFASPSSKAARRAIRISCAAGAIPTISNAALSAVPKQPARCTTK